MKRVKCKSNLTDKKGVKKSRHQKTKSTTSIENLPNEIFYGIFDYLDGCEIYGTFANLNYRFEQLLHSSSLLLRIKFNSQLKKFYKDFSKQITLIDKCQIYSLNLNLPLKNKSFYSSFIFNSSFHHLQALTLNQLQPNLLLSVLSSLTILPHLSSLTIHLFNTKKRASDIYRPVFRLPMLTRFEFQANNMYLHISLPMATDQQYSPIKYLTIDHCCMFSELAAIVSYTPYLRYLEYKNLNYEEVDVGLIPRIKLANLTNLFISVFYIEYEDFELFLSQLDAKSIKIFTLTTLAEGALYFDAARWEEILVTYLPEVKKFYLLYNEHIDCQYQSSMCLGEPNRFLSKFWMEKGYTYEVKISHQNLSFTICLYEKRWYDYNIEPGMFTSSSDRFSKYPGLTLEDLPPLECQDVITKYIERALTVAQYYHLDIPEEQIFNGTLLQVVDLLPELMTLKIHSLSFEETRDLCEDEVDILLSKENTSKVTKVYLGLMMEITDIYFLMILCPRMEYLKVSWINDMDVELFVLEILDKINFEHNECLRLLAFRIPAADDQMVEKLEKMINSEKLLLHYSIKRVREYIYLQWN